MSCERSDRDVAALYGAIGDESPERTDRSAEQRDEGITPG